MKPTAGHPFNEVDHNGEGQIELLHYIMLIQRASEYLEEHPAVLAAIERLRLKMPEVYNKLRAYQGR